MAKEFSYPFTATHDPVTGLVVLDPITNEPDRLYGASDEARANAVMFGNGYMTVTGSLLRVDANGNMTVTVRMGRALINGHPYELYDGDLILTIPTAHATYGRKDTVILSLDLTQPRRNIITEYITGAPSSSPIMRSPVRTTDRHELILAEITVAANTTAITQANIRDLRGDSYYCGISSYNGAPIDITGIVNQFETYFNEHVERWDLEQVEWQQIQQQQEANWQTQTNQQQSDWEAFIAVVSIDIQTYGTFNFDNLAALSFVDYEWSDVEISPVIETIKITGTSRIVARRTTTYAGNDITANTGTIAEIVYQDDGISVLRSNTQSFDLNARKVSVV